MCSVSKLTHVRIFASLGPSSFPALLIANLYLVRDDVGIAVAAVNLSH